MTPFKYVIWQLIAVSLLFMILAVAFHPLVWTWVCTALIVGDVAGLAIVSAYHLYHGVKF